MSKLSFLRPVFSVGEGLTPRFIALAVLLGLAVIVPLAYRSMHNTSAGCVRCHGDKKLMETQDVPHFYITKEAVEKQSKHPDIECRDCHLGNGRSNDKDTAHKGMLKAILISEDGTILNRKEIFNGPILPSGDNKIYELLPKSTQDGQLTVPDEVRNLLWHDRNLETFNFDPDIAKKTCGKSNCHPQELHQFKKTIMGINYRQRYMRTWTQPYGPHNCGPSFADLPATGELTGAGFSYENTSDIVKNLNTSFTHKQAEDKQKFCNVCHAGCLDCHYTPTQKGGVHSFTKTPKSETCSGSGRGTSICHPGAMQSRRGETYIGGDYSVPPDMTPDVHYDKGIHCVDCHPTGEKGMGDMERKATCQDCHLEIEAAHARSAHKTLDCPSCHISELRGYQITIWGPGTVAGIPNPFKKYSLYYGIQSPPIIVKDQKGVWRPYKIWPHSVGNIKEDVPPSPALMFHWPKGETHDAYYIHGTFDNLSANNKHLLWLQLDQAAHPFGKARKCSSCHLDKQVSQSTWEFFDNYGAYPFNGQHSIIADSESLRVESIQNTTPIELMDGAKLEDFASWLFLKDKWKVPGDFSIRADKDKYNKLLTLSKRLEHGLARLDNISASFTKAQLKRYKTLRGAVLHEEERVVEIEDFLKDNSKPLAKGDNGIR
ncbi:cytochrome c3 family protein [Candidatus Magnetominusculus xianensis]|uniref:Cytochrome C n=1 Tax=Candidatus Magnetominusculus xianensis TaxID=1748249 RepID=A0ABR5SBS8_9BACT|nr:cytochrome c3 family protein [Candidatus Magnetominusculus xianensis]KWT78176.1 cytochrome C [Candidatus Magnetominusculus xianensis]MBF0404687.1 cytochrome c3 family protein [Nitrospirota bacterium]